jgi:glyoxylase-like metal-dependent hydrolase (beta-lactamase superfamily II)/rhodanese-related sulfurtransferase
VNLTVGALRERLARGEPTFLLDVRASKDFAAWKVEGPRPIDTLNVPYTRILAEAEEDAIPAAAAAYLGKNYADKIPRHGLVVAVCAKGGTSAYVAEGLRTLGYDAVNLEGGMAAWGNHYEALTVVDDPELTVVQVARPARGCLSWIVIADGEAAIIDPLRHVDRYVEILEAREARAFAVVDTHAHADHISGGRALAVATGAPYYLHPYDAIHPMDMLPATFDFEFLHERRCLSFGRSTLDVLHVPGHTLGAVALLLDGRFLFGGDTLFIDAVARPDLGGRAEAWTPLHLASLKRLLAIGNDVLLFPGHFSAAGEADPRGAFAVALGALPARNEGARRALGDAGSFTPYILASLPDFPPQYVDIKRVNTGLIEVADDRASELELGKNVCALAGVHSGP